MSWEWLLGFSSGIGFAALFDFTMSWWSDREDDSDEDEALAAEYDRARGYHLPPSERAAYLARWR